MYKPVTILEWCTIYILLCMWIRPNSPASLREDVFSGWQTPLAVWQHRHDHAALAKSTRGSTDNATAISKNWARSSKTFDRWSIYENTEFWPTKQQFPYLIPETSTVGMPWPTVSSLGWPVSDAELLCGREFHGHQNNTARRLRRGRNKYFEPLQIVGLQHFAEIRVLPRIFFPSKSTSADISSAQMYIRGSSLFLA